MYLVTCAAVNPRQDLKKPFLIAMSHVEGTGLNAVACKIPMRSDMVLV